VLPPPCNMHSISLRMTHFVLNPCRAAGAATGAGTQAAAAGLVSCPSPPSICHPVTGTNLAVHCPAGCFECPPQPPDSPSIPKSLLAPAYGICTCA
jgi:hypothetical protein